MQWIPCGWLILSHQRFWPKKANSEKWPDSNKQLSGEPGAVHIPVQLDLWSLIIDERVLRISTLYGQSGISKYLPGKITF